MINYIQFGMLSLIGMALIVISSITIENIINSLDKMLIPCQHGTKYVNDECLCAGTPFTGQYCETCTCQNGFCLAGGGTTPTSSVYGCKCDTGTKYWGSFCQKCNTKDNKIQVEEGLPDLSLDIHECELYATNNNYNFNTYFQNNPDTNLCDTNPQGCYVVGNNVYFNGCGTKDIECNRPDISEEYKCIQMGSNCTGNCSSPFFGTLCEKVCFPDVTYESTFSNTSGDSAICAITRESGGFCDVCNGHGTCGGNGCECFENWYSNGLNKCSMTCGTVNDKTCNGQGACVLYGNKPYCSCTYGWKGELCDIPCPGVLDTNVPCSNNGLCTFDRDTEETSCECNQKFRGEFCEIECPGDTIACNGHGVCNEVGQCTCDISPVIWSGNACNCSSPISCNGHGFCEDGMCKCDFEYEPANNCLDCKKHFFGSTCQFTCNPNGPLPNIEVKPSQPTIEKYKITIRLDSLEVYDGTTKLVGNKNIFTYTNNFLTVATTESDNDLIIGDVATYKTTYSLTQTTGTFILIKGVQILHEGSTGWIQLNNYGPWIGQENNIGCYENGVCLVENFGLSTEGVKCKCNENSVQKYFDGLFAFYSSSYSQEEYCKTCEPGFFPSVAIFNDPPNKNNLDGLQIFVECQLECNAHSCNNYGICNENFGIPGQHLCDCDGNVKDSSYCTECEDDWYPSTITAGQPACNVYCNAATTCNGNGECNDEGLCICNEGYTGNECQIKCLINGVECSGHGKCITDELEFLLEHEISTNTLYKCRCDPQNEVQDQPAEYYGEFCEFSCPLPPWKNALKCNDLGECKTYPIKDTDGTTYSCSTDSECKNNADVSAIISTEFDWVDIKGPYCKKRDKPFSYTIESTGQPNILTEAECKQAAAFLGLTYHSSPNAADRPKGCYYINKVYYNTNQNSINCDSTAKCIKKSTCTDNYNNSRCFDFMNLQRPDKSRSLNCTSDATCKAFLYDYDWKSWCDDYLQAETITVFNGCTGDFAQTFCPAKDIEPYCQNYVDYTNGLVVPHISYCYEKDKSKYPFLISFEYDWHQGVELHDSIVDSFIEIDSKYRSLDLDTFDATSYCTTYMDSKKINVQQVNENTRYLCDGELRSSCKFKTKIESSEEWTPWSVICDLQETQYHNISDAIQNRAGGCHLFENAPRIDLGLTNLNDGLTCNSGSECSSGICKTKCCKEQDLNCATCNNNGECLECIHGTTYNGDFCEANLHNHLTYTTQASHSIECDDTKFCDNAEHVRDDRSCLQYCDEVFLTVTSGRPNSALTLTATECETYATENSLVYKGSSNYGSSDPNGCFQFGNGNIYFNTNAGGPCSSPNDKCIQKQSFKYSNRLQLSTVSKCQCLIESDLNSQSTTTVSNGIFKLCKGAWEDGIGCINQDDGQTCTQDVHCQNNCVGTICSSQKNCNSLIYTQTTGSPDKSMNEEECKMYATSINVNYGGMRQFDTYVSGCLFWDDNTANRGLYFNTKSNTITCNGVQKCIQKSATCRECMAGSNNVGIAEGCTTITCTKTWVEGQGCMDMISNINEAIDLIDKTCDQADSLFPQCPEPVSACDLNICNGEDTCTPDPLSNAGICETKKELDCTCKYGFECERLGFTKYKCKGNFTSGGLHEVDSGTYDPSISQSECEQYTPSGYTFAVTTSDTPTGCNVKHSGKYIYFNTAASTYNCGDNPRGWGQVNCIKRYNCHDLERDFDFVGYCKDNNPVVYYEKFDDFRVIEAPQNVTGTFQKAAVEYIDFWVKTEKFASTSSRLEIYKNDQLLFYFYMNRGQFELNDPTSLQSCPADNPTCPELYTWIYEANVWYHLSISIDWTNQLATLTKGTDTKSSKFLIQPVIASTINNFKIVEGSSKTYFDELIFEKALAIPDALKPCKDFAYCNFDVNYRSLCSDVLRKTQYPLNLEPQLDIINICIDHHKTKTINIQASHAQEDEILDLDWLSYCRFKDSIDYNYDCGYIQIPFGTNDMSVSEAECEVYGKSINKWERAGSWDADPPGCFIQQLDDDKVYYNRKASTVTCADRDYCIQKASNSNLENFKNCKSLIQPIDGDKTCVTNALSHDWTTECTNIDNRFIPPAIKSNCPEKCWTQFRSYDNCTNRTALFETNRKLKDSTCDWTGYCFNNANNNIEGVCSAVECDCNAENNVGVSGESCQLSCPISSDGSACAEGSEMGFCTYSDEQKDIIKDAEDNNKYTDGNLVAWDRDLAYLAGECKCYNSDGTNCDLECMACDNSSYAKMTIDNVEYDALHGFCDKTSAKCECLAPFIGFKEENITTWKGSHHTLISKVFGLPSGIDTFTEIKIRMMQGKESFITNYLDKTTDETNWTDVYDKFIVNPELYQCDTEACSQHDVMMLSDYENTAARFNFNCKEDCPGIIANRIPCSGHGRCGIDGQCVCDRAKVYKGTDAQGAVLIMRVGDKTIRQGEVVSSRLDTTGWRGDDCSVKCPGYDEDLESMENVCSGHGICNDNGGCQCDLGFIGDQCQFRCPGFDDSDKNVCSGHGICELSSIEIVQKKVLRASQKCIGEWSDWSDCDGEYRTREFMGTCDHKEVIDCSNETVSCDGYYSDWSGCHMGYHYRNFSITRQPKHGGIHCPTTQRKECSDNDCIDPMCLYCDKTCFQCVENAVDIGFGCICKLGYKEKDNKCVKTLRKSYVSNDCTMENCAECESNYAVSEYVSINIEQAPDLSADKYDCESYATSIGKSFDGTKNQVDVPRGCYYPGDKVYFNQHQTTSEKCSTTNACIQKSKFEKKTSGPPGFELSQKECQDYANEIQKIFRLKYSSDQPKGCWTNDNVYYYNTYMESTTLCSAEQKCVEKPTYTEITTGKNDGSVTEAECEALSRAKFGSWVNGNIHDTPHEPSGCILIWQTSTNRYIYYYNKYSDGMTCGSKDNSNGVTTNYCVQKQKTTCKRCAAGTTYFPIRNKCMNLPCQTGMIWDSNQKMCVVSASEEDKDFQESIKEALDLYKGQCDQYKDSRKGRCNKYELIGSGTPDLSVSKEECEEYGKTINAWGAADQYSADPTGCFKFTGDNKVYYNTLTTTHTCATNKLCIQNKNKYKKILDGITYSYKTGLPSLMSEQECQYYAIENRLDFVSKFGPQYTCDFYPKGCLRDGDKVYHNGCGTQDVQCPGSDFTMRILDYEFVQVKGDVLPDLSVNQGQCESYAIANNFPFQVYGADGNPKGCYFHKADNKVYYHTRTNNDVKCNAVSSENSCIQKITATKPTITKEECEVFADQYILINTDYEKNMDVNTGGLPYGCYIEYNAERVQFNSKQDTTATCAYNTQYKCIQKTDDLIEHDYNRDDLFDISRIQCEQHANLMCISGLSCSSVPFALSTYYESSRPKGCFRAASIVDNKWTYYYNTADSSVNCDKTSICVKTKKEEYHSVGYGKTLSSEDKNYISKEECKAYAEKHDLIYNTFEYTDSNSLTGCIRRYVTVNGNTDNKYLVWINGDSSLDCSPGRICLQKNNAEHGCIQKNSDNTCFTSICPIREKYIQVNSGDPDLSVSEDDCEEYASHVGKNFASDVWKTQAPSGCWIFNDDVRFNTFSNSKVCGMRYNSDANNNKVNCIKKTYNYDCINSTCVDICIQGCNEDSPTKYKGVSLSISGECICEEEVQTTCDAAIDVMYVKKGQNDMSLTAAECEVYAKSIGRNDFKSWNTGSGTFPHGCLENNGQITYNPDTNDNVECGIIGYNCVIAKHKSYEPEFDTLYNDTRTSTCKTVDKEVFIDVDLFLDKGTAEEVKGTFNCQILSDNKVMCAECNCFNTEMYGKWSSFECETCEKGYGKKQCRDACPGYDGVNERTMCTNNGMCSFGSKEIDEERFFNNAQCVCGNPPASIIKDDNDAPISAINPPVSMVVSSMVYTEFVTIAEDISTTQCQITNREDTCYHYNDQDTACSTCQSSFSGENCRYECDKCLNQGRCDETPSTSKSASCNCPSLFGLSSLLWNINCCPVGFIVPNVLKLNQIPYAGVNGLDVYQLETTFDSTKYCQPCPGVSESQWLDSNAQYTVCGGLFRGKCSRRNTNVPADADPIDQTWELVCDCNEGFAGSVCRCIESLEKAFVNEQTDYGCYGRGTCSELDLYQVELYKKEEKCTTTQHTITKNYYDSIQECNRLCTTTYFSIDDYDSTKTSYTCNCCDTTQAATGFNAYTRQTSTTKMYCVPNAGSYYKDGQVIEAEPGSFIDQSSKANIIFCPLGEFQDKSGQTACKKCPVGKYADEKGSTECKGCPGGKYASDGTETLTEGQISISICKYNCPVATYGEPNQLTANCKSCTEGKYQNEEGQASCPTCPQGTYTKFGIIQVTFGTAKTGTSTYDLFETQCRSYQNDNKDLYTYVGNSERPHSNQYVSGCYLDRNTNKIHFNNNNNNNQCNTEDSVCIKNINTYITCAACDPGKTTEVVGGINKCVNCAAGRYSPGGTACKKCAKFSYQDEEGKVSCKSCKAGTYVPDLMAYSSSHYECADVQLLPNVEAEFADNLALKKDIGIEQCAEYGRQYQCCPNKHKDQFIDCSHTYAYVYGSYVHKNFIECEEAGFKWRSYCCEKLGNSINAGSNSLNIECDVSGTLSEDYRVAKTASECHSISTQAFWRKPSGMIYSNAVGTTEMNDIIYGATKEDPHCYLEVANPFSCFQKRNDEPLNGYFQGVMINYQLQGKGRCKNLKKIQKTKCMTPTSQVKGKTIFGFETGHLSSTSGIGKTDNIITGTGVNAGSTMTIFDFPPKQECTSMLKHLADAPAYFNTGLTTCLTETGQTSLYPHNNDNVAECCYEEQGTERTGTEFYTNANTWKTSNNKPNCGNGGGVDKSIQNCRNQNLKANDPCLRTGPNAYLQPSCGCPNDAWDLIENLDNPTFQNGKYFSVGCKSQMGGNHEVWLYSIQSKIDELTADLTAASSEKHKIDADKTILNQNEPASFDASVRSCHQECLIKKDCTMFTVEDAEPFACFLLLKSLFCCNEGIQTYTKKTSGSPDESLTLAHCVDYAYKQSLPFVEISNGKSPKGCSKLGDRIQYNNVGGPSCTTDDGLPISTQYVNTAGTTYGEVHGGNTGIKKSTYYCPNCDTDLNYAIYDTNQNVDTYMPDFSGYFNLNQHAKYNSIDFKSSTLVTWCKNKCYQINKHYNGHKCQGIGIYPIDNTGTQIPERCDLYLVEGTGIDIRENTVQLTDSNPGKWAFYGPIYSKGGTCIEKDTYGRDCSHQGSQEETQTDGVCETVIDTFDECRVAAIFDRKRGVDAVSGSIEDTDGRSRDFTESGGINTGLSVVGHPYGCFKGLVGTQNPYIFNPNSNAKGKCYKGQADCRCKIIPLKIEETCLHPIQSHTECNEALEEDKVKMDVIDKGLQTKVYLTRKGKPDGVDSEPVGLSVGECKQWAEKTISHQWEQDGSWADRPYGCIVDITTTAIKVYYNTNQAQKTCSGYDCVKKTTNTIPNYSLLKWKEEPDLSISKDECKQIANEYGTNNWKGDTYNEAIYPTGCWYLTIDNKFYYNDNTLSTWNIIGSTREVGTSTESECIEFYNQVVNQGGFEYKGQNQVRQNYKGSYYGINCADCIPNTGIRRVDWGNVDPASSMAKGCNVQDKGLMQDTNLYTFVFYFNTNEVGTNCNADTGKHYHCVKKIEYNHNTLTYNSPIQLYAVQKTMNYKDYDTLTMQARNYKNTAEPYGCILKDNKYLFNEEKTNVNCTSDVQCRCKTRSRQRSAQSYQECSLSDRHINTWRYGNQGMKVTGGGGEGNFHWSDPLDYYIRRMPDEAKATTFINDHALDPSFPSDECTKEHKIDHCYRECVEYEYFNVQDDGTCTCLYDEQYLPDIQGGSLDQCSDTEDIGWTYKIGYDGFEGMVSDEICYECPIGKYNNGEVIKSVDSGSTKKSSDDMFMTSAECKLYTQSANYIWKGETADGTKPYGCIHHSKGLEKGNAYFNTDVTAIACGAYIGTDQIMCLQKDVSTSTSNFCLPCPVGKYGDEPGQTSCKTCLGGKYNSQKGAILKAGFRDPCIDCPRGLASMDGQEYCSEGCLEGYFIAGAVCAECWSGQYSDGGKVNKCKVAPQGMYLSGSTSRSIGLSSSSLRACPEGYYQDEIGKYDGGTNACDIATYSTVCKQCPNGKFSYSNQIYLNVEGSDLTKEYFESSIGTYDTSMTYDDCVEAASQNGKGMGARGYSSSYNPKGCFSDGSYYYFNTAGLKNFQTNEYICDMPGSNNICVKRTCILNSGDSTYKSYELGFRGFSKCTCAAEKKTNDQGECVNCRSNAVQKKGSSFEKVFLGNDLIIIPENSYVTNSPDDSKCVCKTDFMITSLSDNTCIQCTAQTYSGEYDDFCIWCPAGYEKATTTSTSSLVQQRCNQCAAGRSRGEKSPSGCQDCADGQAAEAGSSFCTTCEFNSKPNAAESECTCVPGYKSYMDNNIRKCEICPDGQYTDTDNLDACKTCPAGQFADNLKKCTACPAGQYQPNAGQSSCLGGHEQTITLSNTNINAVQSKRTELQTTIAGVLGVSQDTVTITSVTEATTRRRLLVLNVLLKYKVTPSTPSTATSKMTKNDLEGPIQSVLSGVTISVNAVQQPVVCSGMISVDKLQCIATCQIGNFHDSTNNNVCGACSSGKYQDGAGKTSCKVCLTGYETLHNNVVIINGASQCNICPAGKTDDDSTSSTTCQSCAAGKYMINPGQSGVCTTCNSGSYTNTLASVGATSCTACEIGKSDDDSSSSTACQSCTARTFQDGTGKISCKVCSTGYETLNNNVVINNGASQCNICVAGKSDIDSDSSTACQNCETSKYQNLQGQTSCKYCGVGDYQDETGQTDCKHCASGKYRTNYDEINSGTYDTTMTYSSCAVAASQNGKTMAVAGYSNSVNPKGCFVAGAYYYFNIVGLTDSCDNGSNNICVKSNFVSSSANDCKDCPTGKYENGDQDSCENCAAGKFQSSSGQTTCTECSKGKYQPSSGQPTCKDCEAGKYQHVEGRTGCNLCFWGTYSSEIGKRSECTNTCLDGQGTLMLGASSYDDCKNCPAGKYSDNFVCQNCPDGKYSVPESNGRIYRCTLCTEQFGYSGSEQVGCMSSDGGRDELSDCKFKPEASNLKGWSQGHQVGWSIANFGFSSWQRCFADCVEYANCEYVLAVNSRCYLYTNGEHQVSDYDFYQMTCNSYSI